MTTTPRLGITQLEEDQALPEVVVNEADLILEIFATRPIVLSKGDNAPAGGEVDGDAYLVGAAGTGAFLGEDNKLALRINGAWVFRTAKEGMKIEVLDEDTEYVLRGGTWVNTAAASIEVLDEGASETTGLVSLDFVGAGVSAADDGFGNVTVTIAGTSGAGVPSGTSFPGSPASGDHFYRTDRNIQYFYDGTRWLSTQLHSLTLFLSDLAALPATVTGGGAFRGINPFAGLYDIYAVDAVFAAYFSAAANWTLGLLKIDGNTFTSIATGVVSVGAAGESATRTAINAVVASTVGVFQGDLTENSGSANAFPSIGMTYRLVG
jgi:hypothetical protein